MLANYLGTSQVEHLVSHWFVELGSGCVWQSRHAADDSLMCEEVLTSTFPSDCIQGVSSQRMHCTGRSLNHDPVFAIRQCIT